MSEWGSLLKPDFFAPILLVVGVGMMLFSKKEKVKDGANILVLSDRGVDENHMPIPSLLAVSAVHQYLVKTKKRTSLAIILESGEPREVHHFATLLGYGACAVNPYLAQDTIQELIDNNLLNKDYYAAVNDYNSAILHGIVKIASKMGISTIQSYQVLRFLKQSVFPPMSLKNISPVL